MNYEQKYKEALERAMKLAIDGYLDAIAINDIFPELKESEDERIRKAIISHLQHEYVVKRYISDVEYDEWVAWLEKQGEKSTIIDVDKMVMEYSQTKDGDFGLPVNCMIKAYKKGINDALSVVLNIEKQGEKLDAAAASTEERR